MPVLSFKVSAADARAIRARARARKKTVSAFLRDQALGERTSRSRPREGTHPASGLTYDRTVGRKVTEEEIRAVLADFP
jgi:hypothetical protein